MTYHIRYFYDGVGAKLAERASSALKDSSRASLNESNELNEWKTFGGEDRPTVYVSPEQAQSMIKEINNDWNNCGMARVVKVSEPSFNDPSEYQQLKNELFDALGEVVETREKLREALEESFKAEDARNAVQFAIMNYHEE